MPGFGGSFFLVTAVIPPSTPSPLWLARHFQPQHSPWTLQLRHRHIRCDDVRYESTGARRQKDDRGTGSIVRGASGDPSAGCKLARGLAGGRIGAQYACQSSVRLPKDERGARTRAKSVHPLHQHVQARARSAGSASALACQRLGAGPAESTSLVRADQRQSGRRAVAAMGLSRLCFGQPPSGSDQRLEQQWRAR